MSLEQQRLKAKALKMQLQLKQRSSVQTASTQSRDGTDRILDSRSGQVFEAPNGTAKFFSDIQNDSTFDSPSSIFEETTATFDKQGAYIALVANAYGLVSDKDIASFYADRSRALSNAKKNQPQYMNDFESAFENANGFFESTGVILSSPQAIGRQIITGTANSALPLLTTVAGAGAGAGTGSVVPVVGTAVGGVAGSVGGAFVGGAIVEIGAEIDGMMQEAGVDPTDAKQVLLALNNDEFMQDIKIKAERKGLTTASVDALFQVVGGRFLKMAKGSGKVKKAGAGALDVGIQSVGEGTGEFAGQFAKDGTVDFKGAALEAITGLGQSVGQTAIGASVGKTIDTGKAVVNKIDEVSNKVEQKAIEIESLDVATDIDADNFENEISQAEREIASAVAENQIIDIEQQEQASFIKEAETYKEVIKEKLSVDKNKPQSLKKKLGYTPVSISQFIKKLGGIQDYGGELKARDITNKSLIGIIAKGDKEVITAQGKQILKTSMDYIKQSLFDAGYFRQEANDYNDISDSDVYDAIANDISGDKVYTEDDTNLINEFTDNNSLDQELFERGIDPNMTVEQIADVFREEQRLGKYVPREKIDVNALEQIESANKEFQDNVDIVINDKKGLFSNMLSSIVDNKFNQGVVDFFGKALVPISTRIKNISPKLFIRLRKFEFDVKKQIMKDNENVIPFIRAIKNLDKKDAVALDLALKNGQTNVVNDIARIYGIEKEVNAVKDTLDAIYERSKAVGMDINYRFDFFPRRVKDLEGLLNYFKKTEYWNVIQEAIKQREENTKSVLDNAEKTTIINTLMRGGKVEGISFRNKGIWKERTIDKVTAEIDKFYDSSDQALLAYITVANEAVETSKLFGRGQTIDGKSNIEDSVGAYVNDLVNNNDLTLRESETLRDALNARFNPKKMGFVTGTIRDLSYIDVMGSPLNAITQVGDLATSMYNAGLIDTFTTLPRALTDKTKVTLNDIGIEDIAQEFDNNGLTSKAVTKVFSATGLNKVDRVGKLTLLNSELKKITKLAKKDDKKFIEELNLIFGNESGQVLQDLKNGVISENVKFLTFNKLLDMQPVALSEMPEYYLRSGNLKILYMLKTFTIKQLDIYRREIFTNLNTARKTGDKKLAIKAVANAVKLYGYWVAMGSSADYLKDLLKSMFSEEEQIKEPDDYVIDNMLKALGFSRYQANMISKQGIAETLFDIPKPPTKLIDNLQKDWKKFNKEGLSLDNSKSIRSIPVGGELYYFWFGGASGKEK